MKIGSQISYQQNSYKSQAFKGYFACPIRELHVQSFNSDNYYGEKMYPMIRELNEKCKKYFQILVQLCDKVVKPEEVKTNKSGEIVGAFRNNYKYGQDDKLFTEKGLLTLKASPDYACLEAEDLARHLKMRAIGVYDNIVGGNCFLGKKPNGENFALIGEQSISPDGSVIARTGEREKIAESLGIKPENVYTIQQPDYHLDVAIRPLKYPYVLVNDMDLTKELVESEAQRSEIDKINSKHKQLFAKKGYSSAEQTAENLKKYGFKPIFVPGTLGRVLVNFMNAIVHENPDGSLVYITNHTNYGEKFGINMEKIFSEYLKKVCPYVKDVIFINGDGFISDCLVHEEGGIHCLTSERPDFGKWKQMQK